ASKQHSCTREVVVTLHDHVRPETLEQAVQSRESEQSHLLWQVEWPPACLAANRVAVPVTAGSRKDHDRVPKRPQPTSHLSHVGGAARRPAHVYCASHVEYSQHASSRLASKK